MNRTNICKMIIQFIKDYITDPTRLKPHRAENHFIRNRTLSMLHVIIYLFYSSKASMYQNLSSIRDDLTDFEFPSISKQALSKARQFINPSLFKELYYLSVDLFINIYHPGNSGMVTTFLLSMDLNLNFPTPNPILSSLAKCLDILI